MTWYNTWCSLTPTTSMTQRCVHGQGSYLLSGAPACLPRSSSMSSLWWCAWPGVSVVMGPCGPSTLKRGTWDSGTLSALLWVGRLGDCWTCSPGGWNCSTSTRHIRLVLYAGSVSARNHFCLSSGCLCLASSFTDTHDPNILNWTKIKIISDLDFPKEQIRKSKMAQHSFSTTIYRTKS